MEITKVSREGKIILPPALQSQWKDAQVILNSEQDTLYIKKIQKIDAKEIDQKLKNAGRGLTSKDIDKEVQAYRKG